MSIAFPLKALLQPTGNVVLGEFLESDFVSILDGGTGAGGSLNVDIVGDDSTVIVNSSANKPPRYVGMRCTHRISANNIHCGRQ